MKTLTLTQPDDLHCHLRWLDDDLLDKVLPWTARHFARAIVMPNLNDAMVSTAEHANEYRYSIELKLDQKQTQSFQPLMTIKITPTTTPEIILEAKKANVFAAKFYPRGVTTNSAGGIENFEDLKDVYACLQEIGMPALFHCEMPNSHPMIAEDDFIPILKRIMFNFPRLKLVVEHVTSKIMLDYILEVFPENVGLSLTAHHLVLTQEDVYGNPWNFCKPISKTAEDRDALITAAISGSPRIWFGSDSAPHPIAKKISQKPAAGIWTAPVALSILASVFEKANALDRLEYFTSGAGANWYGLPKNEGQITLLKQPWHVPHEISGIVPFMAGKQLDWIVQ